MCSSYGFTKVILAESCSRSQRRRAREGFFVCFVVRAFHMLCHPRWYNPHRMQVPLAQSLTLKPSIHYTNGIPSSTVRTTDTDRRPIRSTINLQTGTVRHKRSASASYCHKPPASPKRRTTQNDNVCNPQLDLSPKYQDDIIQGEVLQHGRDCSGCR
jgi:hypothetical protein